VAIEQRYPHPRCSILGQQANKEARKMGPLEITGPWFSRIEPRFSPD
jgi:hypothetical protein